MSAQRFAGGVVIMVVCILTAIILALCGGLVIDQFYGSMFEAGMYDDVHGGWDTSGEFYTLVNAWFFFCIAIALVGVIAFVLSWLRREGVDTIYDY